MPYSQPQIQEFNTNTINSFFMYKVIITPATPLLLTPDFPGRIYIFAVIFGIGLWGDYRIIPLMQEIFSECGYLDLPF